MVVARSRGAEFHLGDVFTDQWTPKNPKDITLAVTALYDIARALGIRDTGDQTYLRERYLRRLTREKRGAFFELLGQGPLTP